MRYSLFLLGGASMPQSQWLQVPVNRTGLVSERCANHEIIADSL